MIGMAVDGLIAVLVLVAAFFGLVGSWGLIKLPDLMTRLHAPTKATTLGVGGVLIASMLYFWLVKGVFSFHELMITLFLFLTAPISASFLAKTFMQSDIKPDDLPKTECSFGWAIYDDRPSKTSGD